MEGYLKFLFMNCAIRIEKEGFGAYFLRSKHIYREMYLFISFGGRYFPAWPSIYIGASFA